MGPTIRDSARYPNFDFLRAIAALAVIFSHAFLIADGNDHGEPLIILTRHELILGLLGVFVFFAMSGFLVSRSYDLGRAPVRFLRARSLRIFPGLALCVLLCAFVLGPLLTRLPLPDYLVHPGTWRFIGKNLILQNEATLPGVVFADKPAGGLVEGTFWTLGIEFSCYLIVLALGMLRLLNRWTALALFGFGLAANQAGLYSAFGYIFAFFAAGMCLYFWRDRLPRGRIAAFVAFAILAVSAPFGKLTLAFLLFGTYLTIRLATSERLRLPPGCRFGDLSYGLYIYGWPSEALIDHYLGPASSWPAVFLGGLLLAVPLSLLSWHLVEKRALRLKGLRRGPTRAARSLAAQRRRPEGAFVRAGLRVGWPARPARSDGRATGT